MISKDLKELFDTNASIYVLSTLMHNPLLIQDEKYAFVESDFYKPLQKMVFMAIYNMAQQGVSVINPHDIDLYIKQYDSQYQYYTQQKGYDFVLSCNQMAEGSDIKQFDYYYARLKKLSMLRDLELQGFDTSSFYDPNKDILNKDAEDRKLNATDLKAIPARIRDLLVTIENRHIGKDNGTAQSAAKGIRALVKSLEDNPEVGLPLDGDFTNYAARGARLGKLYTYSAPSGAGKTRYMVANACAISLPYINNEGKLVVRGDSEEENNYQKVLFVTTEQQADEIQTMILAYVSGVNEKNILLGKYTPAEKDRINMALDIIEKYSNNFIIEAIPDPSIAMIKARLVKYIVQDEVEYIFYDYIFSSPGLLSEFSDVGVREDVALMMLSNTLKEVAMSYNIFIQTATQLNDGWSKKEIGLRDQNCLRGSKAIADKIDLGMIGIRIPDEERKQIKAIWEKYKQTEHYVGPEPNIVIDIYKNRRGELNGVKIFRFFDYGTLRSKDLFITDASYKAVEGVGKFVYKQSFLDLCVKEAASKK